MNVKIKLIDDGIMPTYSRIGDACLDCYAAEDVNIMHGDRKLVKLGFALKLPEGYEAVIRPRSGLSRKGIDIAIGTVDSNFVGEVSANVINNCGELFPVRNGDRICQLAIRQTEDISFIEVDKLEDTNRGSNGFGSSGIR